MKEYIKPAEQVFTDTGSYINQFQLLFKLNEVIRYLNEVISVGLLPIPEEYKEEEDED